MLFIQRLGRNCIQNVQEDEIKGNLRKRRLLRVDPAALEVRLVPAPSLHERTTAALRDMIVEGELVGGQRLKEAELCRTLGISRTPLREAFKVLAGEGLIDIQPNRGASVAGADAGEIVELFTVIAELESLAAATCARSISAEDLARLELLHRELLRQHAAANLHEYFALNDRIHRAVVLAAGNRVLVDTHRRLLERARRTRYQALLVAGRRDESVAEHEALMAAIRNREPAKAARIARQHVRETGDIVAAAIAAAVGADAATGS